MFNKTTLKNHIYRLNWGDQVWEDTGVVIDDRSTTKADTLFVDDAVNPKLYVASHVYSGSGNYIQGASTNRPRLYRFSYSRATQSYTLDAGFPVTIGDDRAEAMTIARDATSGRLWVTYVSQERATPVKKHQVFINATTTAGNDLNWTGPQVLSTPAITATDVLTGDLAAVVVASGKVAVVWNNGTSSTTKNLLNVAYRAAGFTPSNANSSWSLTQIPIPEGADDHINLKSLQANGTGQIFVALKTSAPQTGPSLPHIEMVAIDISGAVTSTYAIRTFSDNLAKDTRPIVVLDEGSNPASVTDDKVYLFVTGSDSGSKICYGSMAVKLPLSGLATRFKDAAGLNVDDCGTSFIEDGLTSYKNINNATSMKGSANSTTGIVVLASDNTVYTSSLTARVYVHNVLGNPPPVVTARGPGFNAIAVAATAPVTATFSKPMSATTISGVTFKVRNASGPVAGTVSYNPGSRTASFAPAAPLQANTVYTVELTNAIKDSTNLALGGNFRNPNAFPAPIAERWKFTTGSAAVNFALTSYSVLETAPSAVITLTLNTTSTTPVSVTYTTSNGTATAGAGGDYTTSTGVVSFAANQRVKTFSVPLLDDFTQENNETVNLTLSAPVNGVLGLQSTAQLILIDNEGVPSVQFGSLAPVLESAGVVNIQATLSHSSTTPISVNYLVDGGTAAVSTDYSFVPGTLNFPANTTTASFQLTVTNDIKDELDETVILKLSSPTPVTIPLGVPGFTTTLTILDDDLAPGVKFSSATETAGEADSIKQVMVNLTAPSELPVSVVYATSNISATGGEDYAVASGTLTFNPGEISKPIDLSIINDSLDEEDEPFDLALLSATNATLEAPFNAAVTITDDDAEPTISFTTASLSKNENAGVVLVSVKLSTASGRRVIVDYSATDGTATEGQDFEVTQGQLIFAPAEIEQSFEVPLVDDTAAEGNETVNLILNNAAGATIAGGGNATLTINDNDGAPTISFSSATYNVSENAGFATVTVNLNVALASAATVDYAVVAGGTATSGGDYTLAPGKLTFNPGETSKSFQVAITNDAVQEVAETVLLQLSNATNAALGTANATLTIADDDVNGLPQVAFSSATYSVGEKGGTATVTVTLSAPAAGAVTVNYATANGTATAGQGNDYTTASGTLTFNAGESVKSFTVTILDDAKKEGNETVTITLTSPAGAALGTIASATLTIVDNENGLYLSLIRKP